MPEVEVNGHDEDFGRFCEKAHLQILILGWIMENLADRQKNGGKHSGLDALEESLVAFAAKYRQKLDFKFDRGDHLVLFAHFLIVSGVEAALRSSEKCCIIDFVNKEIKIEEVQFIGEAVGIEGNSWNCAHRMRNSFSHFRYNYDPISGALAFEDFDPKGNNGKGQLTAKFSISLVGVLDFSYKFGRACALYNQRKRLKPATV